MSTPKAIAFVIGIAGLYAVLIFLGGALAGAGHGSDYFVAALLAPFSSFGDGPWVLLAGLAFWALVASLIALRSFVWCRFAAGAVLIAHYLGVIFVSSQRDDWHSVGQVWRAAGLFVVLVVGAYFISHGFMWALIARRRPEA